MSDRFRSTSTEKLTRLEKHDHRIMRVEVEVEQEQNPRQHDRAVRVELTAFVQGAGDARRGRRRGQDGAPSTWPSTRCSPDAPGRRPPPRAPRSRTRRSRVGEALADAAREAEPADDDDEGVIERKVGPITVTGDGPLVVREKTHTASPMTLDQALYEMELVGHDFYLFVDKESERPSVVYRRRGYDYGVISLDGGLRQSALGVPRIAAGRMT